MHLRTGCLRLSPGAGLGKSGVDAMAGIRKVGGMVFSSAQMDETLALCSTVGCFHPAHAAGHVTAPTIRRWQQRWNDMAISEKDQHRITKSLNFMIQAEEKLQACQQEAKQQLPPPPHVGRAYLEAAAAVLEELAVKLAWRAHFCQLVAAARGMTLHPQSTSPRTIKVRNSRSLPCVKLAAARQMNLS